MNQTITLTPEQIEEFNAGKPVTITLQKPVEQWEPNGGKWTIGAAGSVYESSYQDKQYQQYGTEYQTKELAEKARDAMRIHNRLLAYVLEYAPDWEADWETEEKKWYVYFDKKSKTYETHFNWTDRTLVNIYMPEQVAKELCEKLNNGIVKL